jgi:hypothetical protein
LTSLVVQKEGYHLGDLSQVVFTVLKISYLLQLTIYQPPLLQVYQTFLQVIPVHLVHVQELSDVNLKEGDGGIVASFNQFSEYFVVVGRVGDFEELLEELVVVGGHSLPSGGQVPYGSGGERRERDREEGGEVTEQDTLKLTID